jgi:hypothetical protein
MLHWACAAAYATIAALGLAMSCRPVPLAGIPQIQQPISDLPAGPANGEQERRQPTRNLQAGPVNGGHQRQQQIKNLLMGIRLTLGNSESVATLPPFSPIEGQKWFDQISSQWESQKNRFALTYFGKIQFLPPCIWNLPFMSTASALFIPPF